MYIDMNTSLLLRLEAIMVKVREAGLVSCIGANGHHNHQGIRTRLSTVMFCDVQRPIHGPDEITSERYVHDFLQSDVEHSADTPWPRTSAWHE